MEQDTGWRIVSVNVGTPTPRDWAEIGRTSIEKLAVEGRVGVHRLGVDGDQISDTKSHGGIDQAVYAFSREELDWWTEELGSPIRDGQFGENLTVRGEIDQAEVGDHWAVGSAVFEVASIRIPCNDFKNWQGVSGFDNQAWVKRFTARERPGPYLRVLQEGEIGAGDPIRLVHRQGHGITVSEMFRAVTTQRDLLPRLLAIEGLVEEARLDAEKYVAAH